MTRSRRANLPAIYRRIVVGADNVGPQGLRHGDRPDEEVPRFHLAGACAVAESVWLAVGALDEDQRLLERQDYGFLFSVWRGSHRIRALSETRE
ncbi:MAG: hypothetical protein HY000_35425 [Planctomycetes bacterium]|nr:hypothetical protein [Planctomycetota bacterium]